MCPSLSEQKKCGGARWWLKGDEKRTFFWINSFLPPPHSSLEAWYMVLSCMTQQREWSPFWVTQWPPPLPLTTQYGVKEAEPATHSHSSLAFPLLLSFETKRKVSLWFIHGGTRGGNRQNTPPKYTVFQHACTRLYPHHR